jgi:hypothetical protein
VGSAHCLFETASALRSLISFREIHHEHEFCALASPFSVLRLLRTWRLLMQRPTRASHALNKRQGKIFALLGCYAA